jgi:hypothetical protein
LKESKNNHCSSSLKGSRIILTMFSA